MRIRGGRKGKIALGLQSPSQGPRGNRFEQIQNEHGQGSSPVPNISVAPVCTITSNVHHYLAKNHREEIERN